MKPRIILKSLSYILATACGVGTFVLQIGWTRELSIPMGGNTLAVATILFAFLVGFGSGAEYFGRLADRVETPLKQFGWLAFFAAISSLVVSAFFWPGIFGSIPFNKTAVILSFLLRFGLSSILIFIPTFFVGGLLPTLLRSLSNTNHEVSVETGVVYSLYSAGGVAGTLLSGFLFVPLFGTVGTLTIAVAIFAFIATAIWALHPAMHNYFSKLEMGKKNFSYFSFNNSKSSKTERSLLLISLVLIGGISIALQIIWSRTLGLMLGSSIFGFSIMISACLVGISTGSYLTSRFIKTIESPFAWFGPLVILAGVTSVGTSWFMNELPWWFRQISTLSGNIITLEFALKFLVSSIVMLPPMAIIGGLFPISVHVMLKSPHQAGRTIGRIFALYMVGCGAGVLFVLLLFIPSLGLRSTIAIITSTLTILGALLLLVRTISQKRFIYIYQSGLAILFAIINLVALPPWNPLILTGASNNNLDANNRTELYRQLASTDGTSWIAYEDGLNASVSVIERSNLNTRYLTINGRAVLSAPIEVGPSDSNFKTQTMMAIIPIILQTEEPTSGLVLGNGTGTIVSTILKGKEIKGIDVIEGEPAIYKMSKYFNLPNNITESKITRYLGDARDFLLSKNKRYNFITSSAPSPWEMGGASNFSVEFYNAVAEHLVGDGLYCQWLEIGRLKEKELRAVIRTFRSAFPVILLVQGGSERDLILVGSKRPIHINIDKMKERLKLFSTGEETGLTFTSLLPNFLIGPNGSYDLGLGSSILTDKNPWIEFSPTIYQDPSPENEKANWKLLKGSINDDIVRMIQINRLSSSEKASILAQIAIEGINSIQSIQSTKGSSPLTIGMKNYVSASFEKETTPEGLYAYSLLINDEQDQIFQEAMNYPANFANSLLVKGEISLNSNKLQDAKNYFKQAIEKDPQLGRAFYLNGATNERLNQQDEAIKSYKKGAELGNSDAAVSLGNIYFKNEKLIEAEECYKKATILNPNSWVAWDNLGKLHFKLKNVQEAIKDFNFVITLRSSYSEPYRYLGQLYNQQGNTKKALEEYEIYLSLNPDNQSDVEREIASIKESLSTDHR